MTGERPTRTVDERKTRRALRKLRRVVDAAKAEGRELSEWEAEFARSLEERLTTFGSAFRDPAKGRLDEPLSARQARKVREIAKKGAGGPAGKPAKIRKPLRARKPMRGRAPFRRRGAEPDSGEPED
ncbi:MAG: hypothetical protein MI723_03100 [Caulobacterales bacterium]|nr:hypothetical protein [Caulobacterales bacterium]